MSVFVVLSSCEPKPNMVNIYMHYMEKDNCEIRVLITPAIDLI